MFGTYIIGVSIAVFMFAVWIHSLWANARTGRKRRELIDRWKNTDHQLAVEEYNRVDYSDHHRALLLFRNPKKLYGPLTQGIWNDDVKQVYSPYWWRCYNEVYLEHRDWQKRINAANTCNNPNNYLPAILRRVGLNIHQLLGEREDEGPPKFSMIDGADEYDQIIAAQEIMEA